MVCAGCGCESVPWYMYVLIYNIRRVMLDEEMGLASMPGLLVYGWVKIAARTGMVVVVAGSRLDDDGSF